MPIELRRYSPLTSSVPQTSERTAVVPVQVRVEVQVQVQVELGGMTSFAAESSPAISSIDGRTRRSPLQPADVLVSARGQQLDLGPFRLVAASAAAGPAVRHHAGLPSLTKSVT
jgi:hypothetical protein